MNWSPVLWGVIIVAYVLGFIAGFFHSLLALIIALILSLVGGISTQFEGVAEDVKSALLGFPTIIVPVATLALIWFGYFLSSDE